ncbi:PD-(D/E)XK nuclease family protein [Polaribacter haliotis]|uniref:PD-(D/E)XK nuclease family protein n=1 Tax=Polaribacter haliotis TaxID=1888915 RepID=A0A7L8AF84_9FLAO|nr:PD-(D/E)XK nuclease family protein [Polaribacter haliotis]QOD60676.1 PD-(D/E)XK nuclease family protein [Polaribacter haliotis]
MIEKEKIKALLRNTKRIVDHQNEMMIAKGENFNIFSVLRIETKEDKTHSAFIAELLNPKGSHKMGAVFLELFLQVISHRNNLEKLNKAKENFEPTGAKVTTEYYIGNVDLKKEKGGRIDVFLKDKKGNFISIENKIYAKDQNQQIKRYYNFKTNKNTVYYLTLDGKSPSDDSKLGLEVDLDFFNISYKDHIISWLELCLKEVPNFSSLRENINQYILLIKKLTNTMDDKYQTELLDLMMSNIEESKFIATNYDNAVMKLKSNFRKDLKVKLEDGLGESYFLDIGGPTKSNKISQLWIHLKSNPDFIFGIESFSGFGHKEGNMFVGLISKPGKLSETLMNLPEENKISDWWRQVRVLKTEDLNPINLAHSYTIKILNNKGKENQSSYKKLLNTCYEQIIGFVRDYEKVLPEELFVNVEKL